jgi:hypothetical protein
VRVGHLIARYAVPGGYEVIAYVMAKPTQRSLRHPWPPPWPWSVEPELELLRAFVDIVAAHEGDSAAMEAAFASALRRQEAREQGQLSVADRRRGGEPIYAMSADLRALFGQPDPVHALIGVADEGGHWLPGLAALTPSEQQAYWLHLHGLSRAAIALAMVSERRRRFGREGALPLATVSQYLWRARCKLRVRFALPLEREEAYLAGLDEEEAAAARQARDVDPARAQPRPPP